MVTLRYLVRHGGFSPQASRPRLYKHFRLANDPVGWRDCADGSPVTISDDELVEGWYVVERVVLRDTEVHRWRAVAVTYDAAAGRTVK